MNRIHFRASDQSGKTKLAKSAAEDPCLTRVLVAPRTCHVVEPEAQFVQLVADRQLSLTRTPSINCTKCK